jgi:hypothetical protein
MLKRHVECRVVQVAARKQIWPHLTLALHNPRSGSVIAVRIPTSGMGNEVIPALIRGLRLFAGGAKRETQRARHRLGSGGKVGGSEPVIKVWDPRRFIVSKRNLIGPTYSSV